MSTTVLDRIESKTKIQQFIQILMTEFEFCRKTAIAIVETATNVFNLDKIDPSLLASKGKVVTTVVSDNAKHGPRLEDLPMVEVTLTKHAGQEDEEIRRKQGKPALRQRQILRMLDECQEQGGTLTQEDLADILKVSPRTIRRDIKQLRDDGFSVPTRGITHDIGPSISHKTKIVKLYLERKTYSEISRIARHSPASIKRYLTTFTQVVFLKNKGLSLKEIAYTVGISKTLAKEYIELYLQYNIPEYKDKIDDLLTLFSPQTSSTDEFKKGVKN
ncbi:DUF1670 domain-containing protein [Fuchsiella alkaliacetigena]|uniref:DUF1670 domain-containing protein n=1 Tax=Fuchsiella alkaliacetigena TaxID=957042 RepID=UPI00200B177D|nr:DUF1670 domain-containing protein [Fuchsiella alkaliacetigena]MCK8826119.1 DUF1670 domain-containing protein [Fuchsiella alkaliacetigena]